MKKTRLNTTVTIALFWVALGILVCYGATQLGLGSITEPGSGFIFFWSGLILVILSMMALAESLRSSEEVAKAGAMNWAKIGLVLLSLLLYAFFLERLGFVLTTFVLLTFLLSGIERTSWAQSLSVASAAALGSFTIFELWLKIRLPRGILGF